MVHALRSGLRNFSSLKDNLPIALACVAGTLRSHTSSPAPKLFDKIPDKELLRITHAAQGILKKMECFHAKIKKGCEPDPTTGHMRAIKSPDLRSPRKFYPLAAVVQQVLPHYIAIIEANRTKLPEKDVNNVLERYKALKSEALFFANISTYSGFALEQILHIYNTTSARGYPDMVMTILGQVFGELAKFIEMHKKETSEELKGRVLPFLDRIDIATRGYMIEGNPLIQRIYAHVGAIAIEGDSSLKDKSWGLSDALENPERLVAAVQRVEEEILAQVKYTGPRVVKPRVEILPLS